MFHIQCMLSRCLGTVGSLSSSFYSNTLSWLGISNNAFMITPDDKSQNLNFLLYWLREKNLVENTCATCKRGTSVLKL